MNPQYTGESQLIVANGNCNVLESGLYAFSHGHMVDCSELIFVATVSAIWVQSGSIQAIDAMF